MSAPSSAQLCERTVSFSMYLVGLANASHLASHSDNFLASESNACGRLLGLHADCFMDILLTHVKLMHQGWAGLS